MEVVRRRMNKCNNSEKTDNQFIIEVDNKLIFRSFSTNIARYNKKTKELILSGDYDVSRLALKYLYKFLNEETDIEDVIKSKKDLERYIRKHDISIVPRIEL